MLRQEKRRARRANLRRHGLLPSAVVVVGFAMAIAIGTGLLLLPWSHESGVRVGFIDTVFTAVSAVTVTGLATVDTGSSWSAFGEVVILGLIQLGGLGMVTSGTMIMLLVSRRLGLTTRLAAQQELPGFSLGDLRDILRFALLVTFVVEAVLSVLLSAVFLFRYDYGLGDAAWNGVFTTVSAFNNAGFALFPDSLMSFNSDPLVLLIVAAAIILGGLGLPVYLDFRSYGLTRPSRWSVHTRYTLGTTLSLLLIGTIAFTLFEFGVSDRSPGVHLLNGLFSSVTARTAGFNSIDYGAATEETLLLTNFLMIIGGGSASTAGGIKVTTFVILLLVVAAEARGHRDVNIGDRRMPNRAIRTALAVTVSYAFLVAAGLMALLATSDLQFSDLLFETISAIATVGLSTGITSSIPPHGLIVLMVLMFVGRLGALTLATAFALSRRDLPYRLPEGQPIIG